MRYHTNCEHSRGHVRYFIRDLRFGVFTGDIITVITIYMCASTRKLKFLMSIY
jgi:hypothetical protein